jgi:D-3-phosphoglycerate dehydrogenase / 2-oxoglutarate reductase
MTRPVLLLTFNNAARRNYYGDKAVAALRNLGELRLNDTDLPLEGEALVRAAQGCQVLITDRQTPAPASLFAALPELAVFQRCAMDIRNVDIAAASAAGVLVTHASAGYTTAVAEWVFGALIDLSRGISDSVLAYRTGAAPAITMGRELRGATLGVIGYGHIGARVAELGVTLGMKVLVADPFEPALGANMLWVSLDALLAQSDHVVCLAAARPETENLMNAAAFARMKPGASFVNASRGNLVDDAALLQVLDAGQLGGCALDVGRAADQMPAPALARHPKVIATPHIGGLTVPAVEHQAMETVSQLAELLRGGTPPGAVNAAQADRLQRLRGRRMPN